MKARFYSALDIGWRVARLIRVWRMRARHRKVARAKARLSRMGWDVFDDRDVELVLYADILKPLTREEYSGMLAKRGGGK